MSSWTPDAVHGLLLVDKPLGPTSTDIVRAARKALGTRKVGHTGTLDPQASGLLAITVGTCTKLAKFLSLEPKVYTFELVFGTATDTGDADGEVIGTGIVDIARGDLEAVLPRFVGQISQVPPRYSAVKIGGKRAYDLARRGDDFEIEPRIVQIERLELISLAAGVASLEVQCGSGTYVRSLATDIAAMLETVGHATAIRRLQVGDWSLSGAVSLDVLRTTDAAAQFLASPLEMMSGLPRYELADAELERVFHGNAIDVSFDCPSGAFVALTYGGDLTAVAVCNATTRQAAILQPRRVLRT